MMAQSLTHHFVQLKKPLANYYALLVGMGLLIWPVIAGIPTIHTRYVWIIIAALCIAASFTIMTLFLEERIQEKSEALPWIFIVGVASCIGFYGASIPYLEFSDEILIALPAYTLVHLLIVKMGWLPLLISSWSFFWMAKYCAKRMQWWQTIFCIIGMAGIASMIAGSGFQSGIALRYPPVTHLIQIVTSILSGAHPAYYRLPNALWTALLITITWKMLPHWTTWMKLALLSGIIFGPLGWTYRTVLFQACGELTIAFFAILLVAKLLTQERSDDRAAVFLGATFSAWFLYRPSSLFPIIATIALLTIFQRTRRSGLIVTGITAPVIGCWLLLSPYYTFQYNPGGKVSLGFAGLLIKMLEGIFASIKALPMNVSWPVLIMLIITSLLSIGFGKKDQRSLLFTAWLIALVNGLMQNAIINDIYYGVARYNILLLLPLGIGLAICADIGTSKFSRWFCKLCTALSLMFLILLTPFNFSAYTQHLRSQSHDIYRTPTEGYLASPLYAATKEVLKTSRTFIIVTPGSQYLDLFVAQGLLTTDERSKIMERSNAWTLATNTERPVIVQGPISTSYLPNLTIEHEKKLRDARAWALTQTGIIVIRVGLEEAIIVP